MSKSSKAKRAKSAVQNVTENTTRVVKEQVNNVQNAAQSVQSSVQSATTRVSNNLPNSSRFSFQMNQKKVATVIGWLLILIGGYALVDLFVQYLDNDYSAAVVNGERIKQGDVDKRLNEKYAKTEVASIIDSTILMQEAKAKNAVATDQEVDAEFNTFKEQFGDDEQFKLLMLQNNTNETIIREQIRNYLSTKKLLEPEINTSDEELQKYFADTYSKTAPEGTKFEDVKEEVKEQYINAQLATKQPELMEKLKNAAAVQNNAESKPSYGLFKKTVDIVKRLMNR